jgi:hypothetical protein
MEIIQKKIKINLFQARTEPTGHEVLAPAGRGEERKCRRQQKPGKLRKRQNS